MIRISYAITVCNEVQVEKLISFLLENKRQEDEICVLLDKTNTTNTVLERLNWYSTNNLITLKEDEFNRHFGNWKNKLNKICKGDYIFQIDADELPSIYLPSNLPFILDSNNVEVVLVPRINTVEGLTSEHVEKWGWNTNNKGWINFPDYQWRVYKNHKNIKWINKVHEKLDGFKTFALLPAEEVYCLYHPKDITKQENQNKFYNTL